MKTGDNICNFTTESLAQWPDVWRCGSVAVDLFFRTQNLSVPCLTLLQSWKLTKQVEQRLHAS